MEKVLFTSSVEVVATRKGIYKDPMKDFNGFRVIPVDKARPCKRRRWGEDPEFDIVMSNFGQTPDENGEYRDQQLIFGFASVSITEDGQLLFDEDNDFIPPEVIEATAYNFVLNHGVANQEHRLCTECGWLVESIVFTKEKMAALGIPEGTVPEGWFVGFYIPDPVVYEKVKNGTYNMFSIEGIAHRMELE